MIEDNDYQKILEKFENETQSKCSFERRDMSDSTLAAYRRMRDGDEAQTTVEFTIVEVPTAIMSALCKATVLGVIAAGMHQIPVPVEDDQLNEEGLREAMMMLFETPKEACDALTAAMYAQTFLCEKGIQHQDKTFEADVMSGLDALPVFGEEAT
jgi:hypothetical protein